MFPRSRTRTAWTAMAVGALLVLTLTRASAAQNPAPDTLLWEPNGPAGGLALSGNTLYVGGQFDYVGPRTGNFAVVDTASGERRAGWPVTTGPLRTLAPDGAGGWFVANTTFVSGSAVGTLVHLRADRSLDTWAPSVGFDLRVVAAAAGVVYVGGGFGTVNDQPRSRLAAIDAATGALLPWNPAPDGVVTLLDCADGVLYVAGSFTTIGGKPRAGLAAVDLASGIVTDWNPSPAGGTVLGLASDGVRVVLVGSFTSIAGQVRNGLAAVSVGSGALLPWNPAPNAGSRAVALRAGTAYVVGDFTTIAGVRRGQLAAVDLATGAATAWAPTLSGSFDCRSPSVIVIATTPSSVLIGGNFHVVSGRTRYGAAALDPATGSVTDWNPRFGGTVRVLVVAGSVVAAAGDYYSVGGVPRDGLAAFDLTTGRPTEWSPSVHYGSCPGAEVNALLVHRGHVYVGGYFDTLNAQPAHHVAVVDSATGRTVLTRLQADWRVERFALLGDTLFIGGHFKSLANVPRTNIAAYDIAADSVTNWNARYVYSYSAFVPDNRRGYFEDFVVSGDTLYAAVRADTLNSSPENAPFYLHAFNARSGAVLPWRVNAPQWGGNIQGMFVDRGELFLSGYRISTYVTGAAENLMKVDATTGAIASWNAGALPSSSGSGRGAFAASGDLLYVGDHFSSLANTDYSGLGGKARHGLAAIERTTAIASDWSPNVNDADFDWSGIFVTPSGIVVSGFMETLTSPDPYRHFLARFPPASDVTAPDVSILAPRAGDAVAPGSVVTLRWSARDDEYVVAVDLWLSRTGPGGPWEPIARGLTDGGSYAWTATGPETGNAWLRVDARDPVGHVGTATSPAPFAIVTGVTATRVADYRLEDSAVGVSVRWRAPSGADGTPFRVERSDAPTGGWRALGGRPVVTGDACELVDADVEVGATYGYRLVDAATGGVAAGTAPLRIRHGAPRALSLERVVPNPVRGAVTVAYELPERSPVRLSLIDVQGREVVIVAGAETAAGRHTARFEAGGQPPGLYFLRLRTPSGERRQRLVVLK